MLNKETVLFDRVRLEAARVNGGLLQETIAHRMQKRFPEKWPENSPVKLVNRAFNGHRILRENAEAMATVLGVTAEYLMGVEAASPYAPDSGSEYDRSTVESDDAVEPAGDRSGSFAESTAKSLAGSVPSRRSLRRPGALVAMGLVLLVVGIWWFSFVRQGAVERDVSEPGLVADARLAMVRDKTLPDDSAQVLMRELQRSAPQGLQFASDMVPEEGGDLMQLARRLGADRVVSVRSEERGRYRVFFVTLASENATEVIWYEAAPRAELTAHMPWFARNIAASVHARLKPSNALALRGTGTSSRATLDLYFTARQLLEDSGGGSSHELQQAYRMLQASVERDPNFALAWAAQCEALAKLYWLDDTQQHVRDAERACDNASRMLPDHPYVLAVNGMRDVRGGREEATFARLADAVASHPYSVVLRLTIAEAAFALWERHGGPEDLAGSLEYLTQATQLDPEYWAPHFWLGTFSFYSPELATRQSGAVALNKAAQLKPNELTLANLGTVAFCLGDLAAARSSYERVLALFPANHLGPEMLGNVLHMTGDYAQAAQLRRQAIAVLGRSSEPQIHQIHGSLADSHRLAGDDGLALDAYTRALEVIARDDVGQVVAQVDYAARAYYVGRQAELENGAIDPETASRMQVDLKRAAGVDTASGSVWKAQSWAVLGEADRAAAAWQAATERCPVYAAHPDRPR